MSYGETLKKWRESNGLTQRQVAEGAGTHVQYISDIERGKRRPGMTVALAIRRFTRGAVRLDALPDPQEQEAA